MKQLGIEENHILLKKRELNFKDRKHKNKW